MAKEKISITIKALARLVDLGSTQSGGNMERSAWLKANRRSTEERMDTLITSLYYEKWGYMGMHHTDGSSRSS